jgi:hypothetical protein
MHAAALLFIHANIHRTHVILLLLVLGLSACAEQKQTTTVEPEGRLPVLDTDGALTSGLAVGVLPKDWVATGPTGIVKKRVSVVVQDGVKALKIITGLEKFSIVRRTRAMLLATPYLNWSWNLSTHGPGTHPIRLIIGFRGGLQRSVKTKKTWNQKVFAGIGENLPEFDRSLTVTWEDSALQRGTLFLPAPKEGKLMPRYIVRGGRENYGKWWPEFIDLGDLYNQVWPDDDMSRVQVSFIGVAASGGKVPTTGYFSEVSLTR